MNATPEQMAKLPKWAQEHINDLARRVEMAERILQQYKDNQTPSEFFYDDYQCIGLGTPQHARRYVQTYKMTVARDGIQADILLRQDDPGIEISFSFVERVTTHVPVVMSGFNQIRIIPKDKLR